MTMAIDNSVPQQRNWMLWTGRIISGVLVVLLTLDAVMKLIPLSVVTDNAGQAGWPSDANFWRVLGFILLASTALYAYPRTAILGAILLTGYLGGAVATHVRIADPLFSHTLFSVYIGIALWLGLWLRDPRLRALTPLST